MKAIRLEIIPIPYDNNVLVEYHYDIKSEKGILRINEKLIDPVYINLVKTTQEIIWSAIYDDATLPPFILWLIKELDEIGIKVKLIEKDGYIRLERR